jgi:hypothetical protein
MEMKSLLVVACILGMVVGCGSPVEPEPEPEPAPTEFYISFEWGDVYPAPGPDSVKVYADDSLVLDYGHTLGRYNGFSFNLADFSPETVFVVYLYGVPEQYAGNNWSKMTVGVGYEVILLSLMDVVPNPVFTFSLPAWLYE